MGQILSVTQPKIITNHSLSKRKAESVKPALGIFSLIGMATGVVVSQGVVVLILQGFGYSGVSFILPLLIGFVLALAYAASFSELSLIIPKAGSVGSYSLAALGQLPSLLAVFCGYVIVAMFAMGAEIGLLSAVLQTHFGLSVNTIVISLFILGFFTLLNLLKIDLFAKIQFVLTFVMFVFLLLVGVEAFYGVGEQNLQNFAATSMLSGSKFDSLSLIALAFWGFVGVEFICPLVEDTKQPEKNIPKAMYVSLIIILLTFLVYGFGALYYVPRETLIGAEMPHYEYARNVLGGIGKYVIGVAVITATCSTVNATLAAIPRMLYGMAQNGQALPCFKKLSNRHKVPWVGVIFIAVLAAIPMVLLSGDGHFVGILFAAACIAWIIAYIINHLNVISLRVKHPQLKRPYKTPFYPLPQILGVVGLIYALFHAAPSPEMAVQIYGYSGLVIGITALLSILWIKLVMKKPLFKPESEILFDRKSE